jgi:hypothetical protein
VGGAVIYFTAPAARPPLASTAALHIAPVVSAGGGELVLHAKW